MKNISAVSAVMLMFMVVITAACAPIKTGGPGNMSESNPGAVHLRQGIRDMAARLQASVHGRPVGKITVADFIGPGGEIQTLGQHISDKVAVELFASGAFPEFMERGQLRQVLQGMKQEHTGYFDQDTVQQFGKMIGVDSMVIGRIEDLGGVLDVTAKIVQSGTGRILGMADVEILKDQSVRSLLAMRRTATLTITVDPPVSGKVIVNGKEEYLSGGVATVSGIPLGECQVLVQPEGYEPMRRTVTVASGSETLGIRLKSRKYEVSFQINPPDASLAVDGRSISLNPQGFAKVSGLDPRKYCYVVAAKGHRRRQGMFDPSVDTQMVINLESSDPLLAAGNKLARKVQKLAGRQDFRVSLWTDRPSYRLGEPIYFNFRSEKECYLNLVDINSQGEITLLFPNRFNSDNRVKAGVTYRIPGPGYGFELTAQPPLGTDRIYAIASSTPIDIFSNDFSRTVFVSMTRGAGTRGIEVKAVGNRIKKTKLDSAAMTTISIGR